MTYHQTGVSVPSIRRSLLPFVGRTEELSQLFSFLADSGVGQIQAVFLSGIAGVGKTRLVQEFVQRARRDGWQVWKGQADAMGNRVAFSSLLQALQTGMNQLSSSERRQLETLYPSIAVFFPSFTDEKPQKLNQTRFDRVRIYESFRLVAERLTRDWPTILWLDDLPESDPETIEWLHYLLRHGSGNRMMVVATCRWPFEKAAPEFNQLRSALVRYGQFNELELQPFGARETAALAEAFVSGEVKDTAVRLLQDRTQGVPLFTVEMLRMLAANKDLHISQGKWDIKSQLQQQVPGVITTVISDRIEGLQRSEQELLQMIAVSDVALPWSVLQKSVEVGPKVLVSALSHLVDLGILDEVTQTSEIHYVFAHPMIHEVVYNRISETGLRHIHKVLAGAWEGNIVRAAYHIRCSGSMAEMESTISLLFEAGRRHLAQHAYRTAGEYLELIVDWSRQSPDIGAHPLVEEAKVLLCEAWAYTERIGAALDLLDELYGEATVPVFRIRIKRWMAWIESNRSVEGCIRHIEEGLTSWDGQSENEEVFWMLNEQVLNYANAGDRTNTERTFQALARYCEMFPSARNSLALRVRQAHALLYDWPQAQSIRLNPERLVADAMAMGDPEWIYDAHCLVGYHALNQGDYEAAVRYGQSALSAIRHYGMVTHEHSLRIMGMSALFQAGNWRGALGEAETIERTARENSADMALVCVLDLKAVIYALRGQWKKAQRITMESEQVMQRALPQGEEAATTSNLTAAVALQHLVLEDFKGLKRPLTVTWSNAHALPIFLKLLEGMLNIHLGQAGEMRVLINDLQSAAGGELNYAKGSVHFLKGMYFYAEGETVTALKQLRDAVNVFDALGIQLESAMARLEWSRYAPSSRGQEAQLEAQMAISTFRKLGAKALVHKSEKVLNKLQDKYRNSPEDADLAVLSRREREIISYVSQGLSTKEIAQLLVVSPRTVSTHLERIYRKIGVHSRTALLHKLNLTEH